jgi:hypothetical protein
MAPTKTHTELLSTIRSLLAKAEASTFPSEAEAFTAKATELMTRYAIDQALLADAAPEADTNVIERRLRLYRPFIPQKAVLVHGVAEIFGCKAIRLGKGGEDAGELTALIGFATEVELVETLVTSLLVQLTTAMTSTSVEARTAAEVASWRRSFIMGYCTTVLNRLRVEHHAAVKEEQVRHTSQSVELVLVDRAERVEPGFRKRYPQVRQSRVSAGRSLAGRTAGGAAGRRANLGGRPLPSRRSLSRG